MIKLSERGFEMPASPIRRLVPLADEATRRGVKVYSLNIGQPDLPTPPEGLAALSRVSRTTLEYSPSAGLRSLREKLAEYYHRHNIDVSYEDIIITTGGSEAVLFAFMSCLDPGDEIIVPEPAYANYMAFAIVAGAKIVTIPSSIESGFALPPIEEFEKLVNGRTRGILICNPNNPTGYLYSPAEMEQLRRIVSRHNLFLFSDEVYREFRYSDTPYVSVLSLDGLEENAVLIDSFSKRYSECGIRVGAIVTRNARLRANIMKFCQARLSPPLLGQLVAEASMDASASYIDGCFEEYKRRRDFLIKGLNEIPGVYTPMPEGAFYTVAKLPVEDADDFCQWCLREFEYEGATVFMAPASGFYTDPSRGRDQVRIAYVLCEEDLAAALRCLRAALEAYNKGK